MSDLDADTLAERVRALQSTLDYVQSVTVRVRARQVGGEVVLADEADGLRCADAALRLLSQVATDADHWRAVERIVRDVEQLAVLIELDLAQPAVRDLETLD